MRNNDWVLDRDSLAAARPAELRALSRGQHTEAVLRTISERVATSRAKTIRELVVDRKADEAVTAVGRLAQSAEPPVRDTSVWVRKPQHVDPSIRERLEPLCESVMAEWLRIAGPQALKRKASEPTPEGFAMKTAVETAGLELLAERGMIAVPVKQVYIEFLVGLSAGATLASLWLLL